MQVPISTKESASGLGNLQSTAYHAFSSPSHHLWRKCGWKIS